MVDLIQTVFIAALSGVCGWLLVHTSRQDKILEDMTDVVAKLVSWIESIHKTRMPR